jgi:hypothetical protein
MFNTTTIPTNYSSPFLSILNILSIGLVLGGSFIELFLYRLREKERSINNDYSDSDSESESSDEAEDNEPSYCQQYYTEFEALTMRQLTDTELEQLNTKIVREEVAEKVEVILTYDKTTETFWYYTDKLKEVSYDILETVARKFAIEYDCKIICLHAKELDAKELDTNKAEPVVAEPVVADKPVPSVFAKFKDYNTAGKGSAPNFTSVLKVIEQMNHFRYRGKLCDYAERIKVTEKTSDEPTLDYASFKKILNEKKEN